MALKLTLADGSGARTLSHGTLSIGRGERNDWVLPDPERHLSKTHCVISIENGAWVLTDLSTNGLRINGARQPTVRDSRTVLTDGDEIRLGEYTLLATEVPDRAAAPLPRHHDPLDIDPLADPLGRPPDPAFRHPTQPAPAIRRTDDPFDRQDDAAHRTPGPYPDEDLFLGARPGNDWVGPSQRDNADAPRHAMVAPRIVPAVNPMDIDFDALIGDLSGLQPHAAPKPQKPPESRPGPDPFAEFDDLVAPPQPTRPAPAAPAAVAPRAAAVAAPAPVTQPSPAGGEGTGALQAFLEGAGVPQAALGADADATLREAGRIFRALTEGLREVLMSRAAIKNELRVDQTLLKSANNNALKFSFSTDDAVIALLSAGRPGYMAPMAAAQEAFDDIKTHEIAVMAGVQTALMGLLRRFDPDALEGRLTTGALSAMVPGSRKARLWDNFRDLHKTIAGEAEDDFQAVFGRAFAKAYKARAGTGEPDGGG